MAIVAYFLVRVSTRGDNLCAEILTPVNSRALLDALALCTPRLHFPTEKQLYVNCYFQHHSCARKPKSVRGSHYAKHRNKCMVRASQPLAKDKESRATEDKGEAERNVKVLARHCRVGPGTKFRTESFAIP